MKLVLSTDIEFFTLEEAEAIRADLRQWLATSKPLILAPGLHLAVLDADGSVRRLCHHDPHDEPAMTLEPVAAP